MMILPISCLIALFAQSASKPEIRPLPFRKIGYFTEWSIFDRKFFPKNLVTNGAAQQLGTINYAFAKIENGRVFIVDKWAAIDKPFTAQESVDGKADTDPAPQAVRGLFGQFRKLKAKFPHLQLMISIGGATGSAPFSELASTTEGRRKFADSCVEMFLAGKVGNGRTLAGLFDGIDLDWEYPGGTEGVAGKPEDTRNFTLLLTELRQQMDAQGKKDGRQYRLSIAAPAFPSAIAKIEWKQIAPLVDYVNLMAYDLHGAWEKVTGHHAPLLPAESETGDARKLNANAAVMALIARGFPATNIVLGIPFYGRGWQGVTLSENGFGQAATSAAKGTYEAGIDDYHVLKNFNGREFYDAKTITVWRYSAETGIFWGFDDARTVRMKAQYARTKAGGLGGVMFWDLSGDDATGTLINATKPIGNRPK